MQDENYTVSLLQKLVDIPSTFPHERDLLLFLESELSLLGFAFQRIEVEPDRWNIHARIGDGGLIICLNTHADTVPPNGDSTAEARIYDGRIYGLGSCDAKASIAAMLTAFTALRDNPPDGTVDLLISVDEEGDAKGVRTALKNGYKCDYAIVGEPTGLNVVRAHCGLLFLDVETRGISTHGSAPWNGRNAIEDMMDISKMFADEVFSIRANPTVGPASVNLGVIHGGDRPNRIPESCTASFDFRVVPPSTSDQFLKQLENRLDYFRTRDVSWRVTKQGNPLSTRLRSPLVQTAYLVADELTGGRSDVIGWRGWTEAEPFQTELGIDAIVFGPGNLEQAHSGCEYVDIEQLNLAAKGYERIIRLMMSP